MKLKIIWILPAVICVIALSGCFKVAQDTTTFNKYYQTYLKVSTSSDVYPTLAVGEETLSKGENAIAASNSAKKGKVVWFKAVAFDDDTSTAIRKYAFVANPKVKGFLVAKVQTLRFDAKLVINPDVLSEPYANDNARSIAILKSILTDFTADLEPLTKDTAVLNSGSLMVKELLKGLIYKLNASPGLAAKLQNPSGLTFDHMNLGKGKTRMLINEGVVELKVMTGTTIRNFDQKLDILAM
jgi:hypothetical protein